MMSLKEMDPTVLTTFLMKEKLVDKAQVEKFLLQDIDGDILLGMSASELMAHLGFTFGKATRLVAWLKSRNVVASSIPVSTQPAESPSETEVEMAFEQVPLAVKKPCSSTSGQRGRLGKNPSKFLPLDPVNDITDLKSRVFHKKPFNEYTNMWGKGYLESYHPRAHATHNKNIEKMRGFFADVYNPVVVNAWTSNFKSDKKSYDDTLQFIESCIPQIEPLALVIRGVNMSIQWTAEDIMRGWFLDHKKHGIRTQRLEQIKAIEIDNKAFLQSIPVAHTSSHANGEKRKWSDADFSEGSPEVDITQPCGPHSFHISRESTQKGSKTLSIREGSQSSNGSVHTDDLNEKLLPFIPVSQQDNKRQKTILVVGDVEYKAQVTASKKLFIEDHSSIGMPLGGLAVHQHIDTSDFPEASQTNQHSDGAGDTEILPHDDEEDLDFSSAADLCAMPSLKRNTTESSISNTSTDAHSPNASLTSTETDDSAKLKHTKKYLHEILDAQPVDIFTATRSELPKESLTRSLKGFSQHLGCGDVDNNLPSPDQAELATNTKMSKLKSIRSSKNNRKENMLPASGLPSIDFDKMGIDALAEDSKLTIAYKAMKLPSKKEVGPQLKSFMAAQNRRVQVFNEHATSSCRKTVPFSGHANMETPALLDLLVKWALEFKVNILNAPKPINGKVRLFAHHVADK